MDDPPGDDENSLVKLTSLGVLGVGLLALFTGQSWFWLVFAVGFAVLVPAVKVVTDELGFGPAARRGSTERRTSAERRGSTQRKSSHTPARADAPESKQDALDTLRDRYARGELDEAEFERKVERLLETETLEGARDLVGRDASADAETDREATGTAREAVETDRDRETVETDRETGDPETTDTDRVGERR